MSNGVKYEYRVFLKFSKPTILVGGFSWRSYYVCATHYIRAVILEGMVLLHLQYVTDFVAHYEDEFR